MASAGFRTVVYTFSAPKYSNHFHQPFPTYSRWFSITAESNVGSLGLLNCLQHNHDQSFLFGSVTMTTNASLNKSTRYSLPHLIHVVTWLIYVM